MTVGPARRLDPVSPGRTRQQGIALLTALFIVALVSIAAAAVYASQTLALKRAANQLDGEQVWAYAYGLEDLVKPILIKDASMNQTDSSADVWAQQGIVFPVQNGTLSGRVVDLQGAFNLNNLTLPMSPPTQVQMKIFAQLVDNLQANLPTTSRTGERRATGTEVANAIRDWADADSVSSGNGGAEDSEYLSHLPPVRTAGRPLLDVSEIRAVQGVSPELYAALTHCGPAGEPCISALPLLRAVNAAGQTPASFKATPININTAPVPLLTALPGANPNSVSQFDTSRKAKALTVTGQAYGPPPGFMTLPPLPPQNQPSPLPSLSVNSSWFQLQATIAVGGTQIGLYSTLFRPTNGQPSVYYRSTAPG